MHPVRFDRVLSVLEHAGRLRWSLLPAGTLWRTPPQPQAARGCSRAVHKLQEALAALRRAGGERGPVRIGTAIDLGARLSPVQSGYIIPVCMVLKLVKMLTGYTAARGAASGAPCALAPPWT